MNATVLEEIDAAAEKAIKKGRIPGCVILVARKGVIVWDKAYGHRSLRPEKVANSDSTIYDLASLTKPVATATAVALLLEDAKLALDDRVEDYIPSFGQSNKSDVTIAHLLTHVSGLKPYIDVNELKNKEGPGPNPDAVIARICSLPKSYETEKSCVYSCLNFVLLARIVEDVSGEPMESLLRRRVWQPLGMKDTGFFLTDERRKRAAPTSPDGSVAYRGIVHDPLARYYTTSRYCCGNAGLFTTARDLATFAQMLLNGGRYHGTRILKPKTVELFTTPQTPEGLPEKGLGWDIHSPYTTTTRGNIILEGHSFGHTGFTGTSLWMDKRSEVLFLILSNRTHLENGAVQQLRNDVAEIVGRSLDTQGDPASGGVGRE